MTTYKIQFTEISFRTLKEARETINQFRNREAYNGKKLLKLNNGSWDGFYYRIIVTPRTVKF